MASLEKQLIALSKLDTDNFIALAEAAKLNPKKDFVGADMSNMDLSGDDLTRFEFFGADFRGTNLHKTRIRSDRCVGAWFGSSKPTFVNSAGEILNQHESTQIHLSDDDKQYDTNIVFAGIHKIASIGRAFDRIGFSIRFVQESPDVGTIQKFASLALHREKSKWNSELLRHLAQNTSDHTLHMVEHVALNKAFKVVYSLRRRQLIWAIEDYAIRTETLYGFLTKLKSRSISPRIGHAIDRILNEREN